MNPFIPSLSFPISLNIGMGKKKDEGGEKSEIPEEVPSAPPTVPNAGGGEVCLDFDQLFMLGILLSILILSTAVVVYAARH